MTTCENQEYRSNEFRANFAVKKQLIRSYEKRDFLKWLSHTIDQYLDKITVEQMTIDFNNERSPLA